jgi:hypothetical protein
MMKAIKRAGGGAQVLESLPTKYKVPSSNFTSTKKKVTKISEREKGK